MARRVVKAVERLWADRPTRWKGPAAEQVAPAMGMVLVKERVRASARKEVATKGARTHLARTHLARIRQARIRLVRTRLRPVLLPPAPRQQPRLNRLPLQRRPRPPVGPFLRG